MDHLCPDAEVLTKCYNCFDPCLPPYRMCLGAHLACGPCSRYLLGCACGRPFDAGPHTSFNVMMEAMRHRCKYGTAAWRHRLPCVGGVDGYRRAETGCPPSRWYTVQQLRDHYRGTCPRNAFVCPMLGCGRACRVDTAVEHYDLAHGPFESVGPVDPEQPSAFAVTLRFNTTVIKKIFNGYFLFTVGSPATVNSLQTIRLTMKNINPADLLQYAHSANMYDKNTIVITMKVNNKCFN